MNKIIKSSITTITLFFCLCSLTLWAYSEIDIMSKDFDDFSGGDKAKITTVQGTVKPFCFTKENSKEVCRGYHLSYKPLPEHPVYNANGERLTDIVDIVIIDNPKLIAKPQNIEIKYFNYEPRLFCAKPKLESIDNE